MQFGNVIKIESQALTQELVDLMYPIKDHTSGDNYDRRQLESIFQLFSNCFEDIKEDFTCFVFEEAIDAFVSFANDVYKTTHNEATGLLVGYYLHDPNNPSKKIVVATNFLNATGDSSNVTCEFSYEDSARHSKYCEEHKVLPIIWIHSHPGFGVFYSGTDSSTLRSYFSCSHQLGIVVDNIRNQYLGYKIIRGVQTEIDIWGINFNKSKETKRIDKFLYNNKRVIDNLEYPVKKKVSFKELQEANPVHTISTPSKPFSFKQENDLLALDSLRTDFQNLKDKINHLSHLVTELLSISDSKRQNKNSFNYSIEEIKREITTQIQICTKEIKLLLTAVESLNIKLLECNKEINYIKAEISSLNKTVKESDEGNKYLYESLQDSLLELNEACKVFKSESVFKRMLNNSKDRIVCLIVFVILFLSLLFNCFLVINSVDGNDSVTECEMGR